MLRAHLFVLTVFAAVLALGSGIGCTSGSAGGGSGGSESGCRDLGGTCDNLHPCCSGSVCNQDGVCAEEEACVEEGGGCDADSPCCEPLACTGAICVAGEAEGEELTGNVEAGQAAYATDCDLCHGTPGRDDGAAPDLARLDAAAIEAAVGSQDHQFFPGLGTGDYADLGAYLGAVSGEGEGEGEGEGNGEVEAEGEGESEGETPDSDIGAGDPDQEDGEEPEPDTGEPPDSGTEDPPDARPEDPPEPSDEALPDFSVVDVNPDSPRFEETVSPRDYLGQISAWYFGHST